MQESHYHYDAAGHLQWVEIADGRPRNVYLVNDNDGRVLGRDEEDFTSGGSPAAGGDPRELHYYFMGQRIGDISNNGTSNTDYVASLAEHAGTPLAGTFGRPRINHFGCFLSRAWKTIISAKSTLECLHVIQPDSAAIYQDSADLRRSASLRGDAGKSFF